jgi:hypothetical protein
VKFLLEKSENKENRRKEISCPSMQNLILSLNSHSELSKAKGEKISISESLTIVIYMFRKLFPQKIKIFGQGNQELNQTECTGITLLNKTGWNSKKI